jgi:hypothetical protein
MAIRYVRIYYVANTDVVRHVACKATPFRGNEGVVDDDVDLDRSDYELIDVPKIISANEVLKCIEVIAGRAVIALEKADAEMRDVKARGYRPSLVSKNGNERKRLSRDRAPTTRD